MFNTQINVELPQKTVQEQSAPKIVTQSVKAFILLFIVLSISRCLFDKLDLKQVSIVGSQRYSKKEILYASGLSLDQDKMLGISLPKLTKRIKKTLSYIKDVQISKRNLDRSVDILVTERLPYAIVEILTQSQKKFALVDIEGYVLKCSDNLKKLIEADTTDQTYMFTFRTKFARRHRGSVFEGSLLPENQRNSFFVCQRVFSAIKQQVPELVSQVRIIAVDLRMNQSSTIRANSCEYSITLNCEGLPEILLSTNLIQDGLRKVGALIRSDQMRVVTDQMLNGYLDARFENVLYWGEEGNGK